MAVVREDDASPEHASSAYVGAPAAAHGRAPGNARPPSDGSTPNAQREQARNTN